MFYVVVTRPVNKSSSQPVQIQMPPSAPSVPNPYADIEGFDYNPDAATGVQICPECDDYGLSDSYSIPSFMLFNLVSSVIIVVILGILANLLIAGLIILFLKRKNKIIICPKCKKQITYKTKKPLRCQYCGALLKEIIKAH